MEFLMDKVGTLHVDQKTGLLLNERGENVLINLRSSVSDEEFLKQVDKFEKKWGYTDGELGKLALGDPNFLPEIRKGERSPTLRTVAKVMIYMMLGEARHSPANRARLQQEAAKVRKPNAKAKAPRTKKA
jgi:hypothetical protein